MATDWVQIGSVKMRSARQKLRRSVEETVIQLRRHDYKTTARNYTRWEERGEVPRPALPAVAAVLGLDSGAIVADQPTRVQWQQVGEVLAEVAQTQKVLVELLAEQREVVNSLSELAGRLDRIANRLEAGEASSSSA